MEKKNRVVSKRLQKQLDKLLSDKRYDEAEQLLKPPERQCRCTIPNGEAPLL